MAHAQGDRDALAKRHAAVPGFERFFTIPGADTLAGGQLLLGELNCTSCHKSDAVHKSWFLPKKAPVLSKVGKRVKRAYLRKFLTAPHKVKPGTTMPDVFAGLSKDEREGNVEALVHLLASTGRVRHERLDHPIVGLGRQLYHQVGCVSCHGSRDASAKPAVVLPTSVPLEQLSTKYTIPGLAAFLANPHEVRPSGRMPGILTAPEARQVAHYLLQDIPAPPPNVVFAYYEGNFGNLPDFAKLKPKLTGKANGFDLRAKRRNNNYALKFDAFLKIEREGDYRFWTRSDDGSRLKINGKTVVNNDGTHAPQTQTGQTRLKTGIHKVEVTFFQGPGGDELSVHVQGPGMGKQPLAPLVFWTPDGKVVKKTKPGKEDEENFEINPQLVQKGRTIFASAGCASCHQLQIGGQTLVSTAPAPTLAKLNIGGCLTKTPVKGSPHFALSEAQRAALGKAVQAAKDAQATKLTDAAGIHRTMVTMNCYACHERNKLGGPEEKLDKFFTTVQPEMGDEGRIPPVLDLVGAKLKTAYFKQVLAKGSTDRPYMHTRMPRFGLENVGDVAEATARVDKLPKVKKVDFKVALGRVRAAGRYMVGNRAFACIKCHTFAGHKAEGVQGIDMTIMTDRVKSDWFRQYLINPQKFRPGTRMPTGWPDGETQLEDLLDGDTHKQVHAIYVYLSSGKAASLPRGLIKGGIELVAGKEAIIYRNFISGAGSRAIGVGYPEAVNLAFDANQMRMALLWQGGFMDAKRHWTGRGQGYQPPLGGNVLALPPNAPFAVLDKENQPWPTQAPKTLGYKFGGYRLTTDGRPTFLYSLGDIAIEDFPNPVEKNLEVSLKRTITWKAPAPVKNLYWRAAVGQKIEAQAKGWYRIDGAWRMRIDSAVSPTIRSIGNKQELLVPIRFKEKRAEVVQTVVW